MPDESESARNGHAETTSCFWIVVMGVSGCGKSTLGEALAQALQLPLIEGDDFHPPTNIEKMRTGVALNDEDRQGWLADLAAQLGSATGGAVLTCSALKRRYREQLRAGVQGLRFVFMHIDEQQALDRVRERAALHFFSADLVANQFAALESPQGEALVFTVPALDPTGQQTQATLRWLRA